MIAMKPPHKFFDIIMKNDLDKLPWKFGQFYRANNYFEAAGILTAIKNGISPRSFQRPISKTTIL